MPTEERNEPDAVESVVDIKEMVKHLILIPDDIKAIRYIFRNKKILFSDEARDTFEGLIKPHSREFGRQIRGVLDLLDECRGISLNEMLEKRKHRETKIDEL